MFLLGLLTELGVTTETLGQMARARRTDVALPGLRVSAETADTFGLQLLGISAAVYALGWILQKVSGERS